MIKGQRITLTYVSSDALPEYIQQWTDLSARGDYFPNTVFNDVFWKNRHAADGLWGEASGHMVIRDPADRMVGAIFFFKPQLFFDYLEIGYILFDTEARGKGYTSEALTLFTDYLFANRPINKIVLNINVANEASLKVAKNNGFVEEGIDREAVFTQGQYADVMRLGKLRREWQVSRQPKAERVSVSIG